MKKIALTLFVAALVASSGIALSQSSSSGGPLIMPRGAVATPGLFVAGDRDTGLYSTGLNILSVTTNGTERARFTSTAGGGLLTIGGVGSPSSTDIRQVIGGGSAPTLQLTSTGGGGGLVQTVAGGQLRFYTHTGSLGSESYNERARIQADGTFSILTTTDSAFALDVNGSLGHNGTQAYWFKGVTTFTSGSGTYTVPSGVRAIKVRMVGGGGGGGYARAQTTANAQAAGGGGQSGYFVETWMTGLSASYAYGVGAGGAGGIASSATAATIGGNTTFSTFTANGGNVGDSATVTTATFLAEESTDAGAKATNTGATLNQRGNLAQFGITQTLEPGGTIWGAAGAASELSGPTARQSASASNASAAGAAGDACGGGGGGAIAWRNASNVEANGGAGAAGCIVIEEYF